jgi:hypothetical protein
MTWSHLWIRHCSGCQTDEVSFGAADMTDQSALVMDASLVGNRRREHARPSPEQAKSK